MSDLVGDLALYGFAAYGVIYWLERADAATKRWIERRNPGTLEKLEKRKAKQ